MCGLLHILSCTLTRLSSDVRVALPPFPSSSCHPLKGGAVGIGLAWCVAHPANAPPPSLLPANFCHLSQFGNQTLPSASQKEGACIPFRSQTFLSLRTYPHLLRCSVDPRTIVPSDARCSRRILKRFRTLLTPSPQTLFYSTNSLQSMPRGRMPGRASTCECTRCVFSHT